MHAEVLVLAVASAVRPSTSTAAVYALRRRTVRARCSPLTVAGLLFSCAVGVIVVSAPTACRCRAAHRRARRLSISRRVPRCSASRPAPGRGTSSGCGSAAVSAVPADRDGAAAAYDQGRGDRRRRHPPPWPVLPRRAERDHGRRPGRSPRSSRSSATTSSGSACRSPPSSSPGAPPRACTPGSRGSTPGPRRTSRRSSSSCSGASARSGRQGRQRSPPDRPDAPLRRQPALTP